MNVNLLLMKYFFMFLLFKCMFIIFGCSCEIVGTCFGKILKFFVVVGTSIMFICARAMFVVLLVIVLRFCVIVCCVLLFYYCVIVLCVLCLICVLLCVRARFFRVRVKFMFFICWL